MSERQYLISQYNLQYDALQWHLGDFSDADMLVRPVTNANHAAWHVGHLAVSLVELVASVAPGVMPSLPAELIERHGKKGAPLNDGFETKDQLLARFKTANDAAIKWATSLTPEQMQKPTPEFLHTWVKTVGELAHALPPHSNMHIGQIQVIRRKLGKPVLM